MSRGNGKMRMRVNEAVQVAERSDNMNGGRIEKEMNPTPEGKRGPGKVK